MGALKLNGMSVMKDFKTTEDVELYMAGLQTDPMKITHLINSLKQELPNATGPDKDRIEKAIRGLVNHLINLANITSNAYSYSEEIPEVKKPIEVKDEVKETITKDTTPETNKTVEITVDVVKADPSKNLKITSIKGEDVIVVDEDRILREKYKDLIKQINVEALELKVIGLFKEGKEADAIEVANFILKNGHYIAKKPKHQNSDQVNTFIERCRSKVVKVVETIPTTETTPIATEATAPLETNEVLAADRDLYKEYANYLGEHAPTTAGLRADTKFDLSNGTIDMAMERATFMLAEGLCNDSEGKKYSSTEIEDWFKAIKEDMVKNPLTPQYDLLMTDLYNDIKDQIHNKNVNEEDLKVYVIKTVTDKKVENLEKFYGGAEGKDPQAEMENMYVTYFLSYVANQYKIKGTKTADATTEIELAVKRCADNNEKTLGKAIQRALNVYREKGEKPDNKEVKEIVYKIAEEKYPEYFAKVTAYLNANAKPAIVPTEEAVDFVKKYPEAWESIKDTNPTCLDDVVNMAKELEKTQSFTIVSEAITHFMSSGKINDKDGKACNWDAAQIELWINKVFTAEPTPAEIVDNTIKVEALIVEDTTKNVETPTTPAPEIPVTVDQTAAPAPSTEKASEVVEQKSVDKMGEDTAATEEVKSDGKAASTGTSTVDPLYAHLNGYVIPAEHAEYTALYAKKKDEFEQGLVDIITKRMIEGKTKTDIKHEIADVLKEIAINNAISQTFARNFKPTSMTDLYKTIDSKATKLEVKGWAELN
jgi:hypothetical protein